MAAVEAPEPAQRLGLNTVADALQRELVITHRRRWRCVEVLCGKPIKDRIDLPDVKDLQADIASIPTVDAGRAWIPPGRTQTPFFTVPFVVSVSPLCGEANT